VHSLNSTFDAPVALSEQASLVEVSPSTVIRLNDKWHKQSLRLIWLKKPSQNNLELMEKQ
jgi:hypothetical protein